MKTAKINRDEVKDETITFTYERPKKKKLQERADKIGISMSAYIRMVLNEKIDQE